MKRNQWLSRNTSVEMVKDRGYATSEKVLGEDEFRLKFPTASSDASVLKYVCYKGTVPVAVHFLDQEKIGKGTLEIILNDYQRENIRNVIFISSSKISAACSSLLHSGIEVFREEELLFNITKHSLVPKHRILKEEEKEEVLRRMKLKPEQMPKILKRDPVFRYLGAECGEVIEIIRKSRTSGSSLYYKLVEDKIVK